MTGYVHAVAPASAEAVFRMLTDIARLSEWNGAMKSVVDQPDRLETGSEWVVEFHALRPGGVDRSSRRSTWRAGGSPTDDGAGSRVSVKWELHPAAFWRRVLFARVRARQLARTEIPASLAALARAVIDIPNAQHADG
ncbi:MAG TPA: SRPBCC family protein [Acidimicrobiales bacterium]|nr:SRPBCC family protein [Acidimicrobiales bacterium]